MLVITRRKDQRIFIGSNVEIVVVEVGGGKVRLGIQAPVSIPVHRSEVADEILAGGRQLPEITVSIPEAA